jgi:S1-C subfamily serine protease
MRSSVVIAKVLPGSQADRSGLKVGDVIASYNGQRFTNVSQLQDLTKEGAGGRGIEIQRDGKPIKIAVHPGPLGVEVSTK